MSLSLLDNPLDVPTTYDLCYTPQNALIFENMRGLNHVDLDLTATSATIRAGSVIEVNGVLLKAPADESVSLGAASLALVVDLQTGAVSPITSFAGYKYDALRRGVYNGSFRLFHTLVKKVAGTTGFTAATITSSATKKFWVSKGLHIFSMRGGKGGAGGMGGTDSNTPGGTGANGAIYQFLHFETKGQWAVAICGYDGMPPITLIDNAWALWQPANDAGGGGGCSGNASLIILQDGTVYYALGGSGGGGGSGAAGSPGSGSRGGDAGQNLGSTGAGGGGAVGSNDVGGGQAGTVQGTSQLEDGAGGGGNSGTRSPSTDGKVTKAGDGGPGPGAGGGGAYGSSYRDNAFGGHGSHGPGGMANGNRPASALLIDGHAGFPSPTADQSWWDLSAAALESVYYPIFSGGGAGGGDLNDERSGTNGATMIWNASAFLSRNGGQTIIDYYIA